MTRFVFAVAVTLLSAVAVIAEPPKKVLLVSSGPDGHPAATHEYVAGVDILAKLLKPVAGIEVTTAKCGRTVEGRAGPRRPSRHRGAVPQRRGEVALGRRESPVSLSCADQAWRWASRIALGHGHFHDNWKRDEYRRLVAQGVLWVTKQPIPEKGLPVELPESAYVLEKK